MHTAVGIGSTSFIYFAKPGQETFPIANTIFLQDTDQAVRRSVLGILPTYTNEDIPGFLKERLLVKPSQKYFRFNCWLITLSLWHTFHL